MGDDGGFVCLFNIFILKLQLVDNIVLVSGIQSCG